MQRLPAFLDLATFIDLFNTVPRRINGIGTSTSERWLWGSIKTIVSSTAISTKFEILIKGQVSRYSRQIDRSKEREVYFP